MKKKKIRKKPSGQSGAISIPDPIDGNPLFNPINYPSKKSDLEDFIVHKFCKICKKERINPLELKEDPIRNKENDLDYTLNTKDGEEYLDLMEIVLETRGNPYQNTQFEYNHGVYTRSVLNNLQKKWQKYRGIRNPVNMLIYPTDWKFRCGASVQNLIAYLLHHEKLGFSKVIYMALDSELDGEIKRLAPYPDSFFKNYDLNNAVNRKSLIANPVSIKIESDGSISLPLGINKNRK